MKSKIFLAFALMALTVMPVYAQVLLYGPGGAQVLSGLADQLVAMNHAGTATEMKTVSGTGGVTVTLSAGSLVIDGASVVGTNPGTGFTASNKTGSFSAAVNNVYFVAGASADATATLPTAVGVAGKEILLVNTSASHGIVIATTSAQTVSGAASASITIASQYSTLRVVSDGANWLTSAKIGS